MHLQKIDKNGILHQNFYGNVTNKARKLIYIVFFGINIDSAQLFTSTLMLMSISVPLNNRICSLATLFANQICSFLVTTKTMMIHHFKLFHLSFCKRLTCFWEKWFNIFPIMEHTTWKSIHKSALYEIRLKNCTDNYRYNCCG